MLVARLKRSSIARDRVQRTCVWLVVSHVEGRGSGAELELLHLVRLLTLGRRGKKIRPCCVFKKEKFLIRL